MRLVSPLSPLHVLTAEQTRVQIDETHRRNQIPIVVGGTAYWIQHLLFPGRLAALDENTAPQTGPDATSGSGEPPPTPSAQLQGAIASIPHELRPLFDVLPGRPPVADTHASEAFNLHRLLAAIDPPIAQRWHWKDTRKVLRSLELIKETGRLSSEIIAEQSRTAPPPRYERTLRRADIVLIGRAHPQISHAVFLALRTAGRPESSVGCPRRPDARGNLTAACCTSRRITKRFV